MFKDSERKKKHKFYIKQQALTSSYFSPLRKAVLEEYMSWRSISHEIEMNSGIYASYMSLYFE